MTKAVVRHNINRKWIEDKMIDVGIENISELGRRIGVQNRTYMYHFLSGLRPFSLQSLQKLASTIHVPLRELIQNVGGEQKDFLIAIDESDTAPLQIRGTIDDRMQVVFYPTDYSYETTTVDIKPASGTFALRYETTNSALSVLDGAVAVFDERQPINHDAIVGHVHLLWLANGKILLRKVVESTIAGKYNLSHGNNELLTDQEVIAYAPTRALALF
ncbi:hypothetical protein [Bartonella sp. CB175]|uniref:hypothetical protein n=1 Tax=Bartonella sp. CB175 TaxID=3112256 RepID=UPI00300DCB8A